MGLGGILGDECDLGNTLQAYDSIDFTVKDRGCFGPFGPHDSIMYASPQESTCSYTDVHFKSQFLPWHVQLRKQKLFLCCNKRTKCPTEN